MKILNNFIIYNIYYMINSDVDLINLKIKSNDFTSQLLNKGAFGKVFIVTFEDGSKVLLKIMRNDLKISMNDEINFLKLIKNKCNEYFVCYITSGQYDVLYNYIVFEYDPEYLVGYKNIEINDEIIRNLYKGLFTLHKLGIIHNDIKPENIIINKKSNKIKYIDFGLSCNSYKCYISGTPNYMNDIKLQRFNLGTQLYNFIDGIYSDLFALNLSIMEMSSLYGYPSDINEYNTKLDALIKLFPEINFDENGWITDLIINRKF